jgi:outer membrane receptor protein involved in Fe transport
MNNLIQKLMLRGSTAALVAIAPMGFAHAQDIEQVVVSASRISIAGYTQPTPVTVVGMAQLESDANIAIGDSLRELPSLGASQGLSNGAKSGDAAQGDAGVDTVSLRNLGVVRTLVLFDGQRVVTSNPSGGGVDLSTIPSALVQRIDVVTGGASAAWGSDAVGGVVNLILNKNFDGFKLNEEFGQNKTNNHQQWRTDASFGTDFDGGRGHAIISGSYIMSPQAEFAVNTNWYSPRTLFPTSVLYPAGTPNLPTYVHTSGPLGSASFTQGGLITSGPLAGTQFTGSPAQPVPFNVGYVFAGNCIQCSANQYTNTNQLTMAAVPYHSTTLFGFARYKITPEIQASVQLNYGTNYETNVTADKQSPVTINSGNPFIPAATQAAMTAKGLATIAVATDNLGNLDPKTPSIMQLSNGAPADGINYSNRQLLRGVFTLEGALGEDWSWNVYVQHSQVREVQKDPQDALTANYNNAVNAVTVTAANVGTSGLPLGNTVCASSLTNPFNGCVPLNIFGNGGVTQAALNYVDPGRNNPALVNSVLYTMYQDVASASMQGTLPWQLPAGKVAVAFGAEYRHEQQRNQAAFPLLDGPALWNNANFSSYSGQYGVTEGFLEVDAPVLKDNIVQSLDVSLAGRVTGYSTSGVVETWKLGATSQIIDDIKVRATWSEDIRAPIISELFAVPQYNQGSNTIDPKTGKPVTVFYTAQGNPNLVPEQANTISGGVVLTPHWFPGLSASFDWYSIVIKGAIFTPTNTQVLNQCAAGSQAFCADLFFGNPAFPQTSYPGQLNLILDVPQNVGSQTASGLDFQSNYTMDLFSGTLGLGVLGNYTDEFSQTLFGVTSDGAGALGTDAAYNGTPKFKLTLQAAYTDGPWAGTIKTRFIGPAKLNNQWTSGVQVDNNRIPWVGYLDLSGSYKWNEHLQIYGTIANFTNTPPPNIPSTAGGNTTNLQIYDGIGRMYQAGFRVNL